MSNFLFCSIQVKLLISLSGAANPNTPADSLPFLYRYSISAYCGRAGLKDWLSRSIFLLFLGINCSVSPGALLFIQAPYNAVSLSSSFLAQALASKAKTIDTTKHRRSISGFLLLTTRMRRALHAMVLFKGK